MDLRPVNKAIFAHAAYDISKYNPRETGYIIDPELSDENRSTFYDPATKKAVVAFRGTHVNNVRDLIADGFIFTGAEELSSRFRSSERTARRAVEKYGKNNVSVTGHSLGGSQALYVNRRLGLQADAYNPGAGLERAKRDILNRTFTSQNLSTIQALNRHDPLSAAFHIAGLGTDSARKESNATIHTTGYDPISVSALLGQEKKELSSVKKGLDPHTVRNFL